ncbi:phage portal protein [Thermogutta sp.]|jgi:capsid protein|uniref:phage portal protein n=1 Tax=Thermogutta sp. TaxID=1962930 RepID=UPI00321F9CDF
MPKVDDQRTEFERILEWLDRDDPAWSEFLELGGPLWPPYRSEYELARIRNESRWFATHHPFAVSALENRASYVVGSGHTYTVRPKPNADISDETLEAIEREITEFLELNLWQHRQIENQIRLDRDGEVFLRFFEVDGRLVVRYIEPEQVSTPPGDKSLFGIITDERDAERVLGYWVRYDPERMDWQRIDADEVQHRKANVDGTMPRGLPTLFAVRANLRRVWKLLRNMTTVASIQAAVAIVRQHGAAPAGSVQQYVSRMAPVPQNQEQSQQSQTYERFPPGAIIDVAPGVEVKFPAEGINVGNYVAAIQAELRAIAARLAMPEYMLSGDASNANYSSTLVAEGPAVKMFERLQSQMIWWDCQILMGALEVAERAGRLPEGISKQIVIDAEAPTVMTRDRLKEAQADQILYTLGIVSPQTLAARYGFDYNQERELLNAAD